MRRAAALGLAACSIAAGCGGSSSAQEEPNAPTLEALWRAPGEDVAVVPRAADFGPGTVRYAFLVVTGGSGAASQGTVSVRELDRAVRRDLLR